MTHTHLKPCPFCGCTKVPKRQGNGIGDYWLECFDCGASTRLREEGAGSEKDWNRRPDAALLSASIADTAGANERDTHDAEQLRRLDAYSKKHGFLSVMEAVTFAACHRPSTEKESGK